MASALTAFAPVSLAWYVLRPPHQFQPPDSVTATLMIKTYRGTQAQATAAFLADAQRMAAQGFVPTSQSWAEGSYGCGSFLIALVLCLLLIGILIFVYMLIVKPAGTLTVTYELRSSAAAQAGPSRGEKTCPNCAEHVKAAAVTCRFCGHSFAGPGGSS